MATHACPNRCSAQLPPASSSRVYDDEFKLVAVVVFADEEDTSLLDDVDVSKTAAYFADPVQYNIGFTRYRASFSKTVCPHKTDRRWLPLHHLLLLWIVLTAGILSDDDMAVMLPGWGCVRIRFATSYVAHAP